jgi:hypothetical protein
MTRILQAIRACTSTAICDGWLSSVFLKKRARVIFCASTGPDGGYTRPWRGRGGKPFIALEQ